MKSYEKKFNYSKTSEESETRDVFVIRETDNALAGYDMKYLSENEQSRVREIFKEHEVVNNFDFDRTKKDIADITELEKEIKTLNKAWRRFSKEKISEI